MVGGLAGRSPFACTIGQTSSRCCCAGPLEAVVNNLTREIQGKGEEGRELQRRWVGWQTELVGLQAENNRLAQDLQRLKAHHTITHHKRTRLRQQ